MLGLKTEIYSIITLEDIASSLEQGGESALNTNTLASTIRYSLTEIRDTLSNLENLVNQPSTYRGAISNMVQKSRKAKQVVLLDDLNKTTENTRDEHFTEMGSHFNILDDLTNRLGVSARVLADYLACSLILEGKADDSLLREILAFSPQTIYQGGKINYSVEGQSYVPLTDFEPYNSLKSKIGNDPVFLSLLNLKTTGAALKAAIDYTILKDIKDVQNYPSDAHSEVVDALMSLESALGFLSSGDLGTGSKRLIKASDRSSATRLTQSYVNHKSNPTFTKVVGAYGLASGLASLYLAIPQIAYWVQNKMVDFTSAPSVIINHNVDITAIVLTSSVVSAVTYTLLTFGSEIGRSLVESLRNQKLYDIVEI